MATVGEHLRLFVKVESVQPENRVKLDTGYHTQTIIHPA